MKKIVKTEYKVPFYSQIVNDYLKEGYSSKEESEYMMQLSCGISCLRMVIDAYLKKLNKNNTLSQREMIIYGLNKTGAYKEPVGWIHQGLVEILKDFEIPTTRKRNQKIDNIINAIHSSKLCIVSTTPRFEVREDGKTNGHLSVVQGITYFNDNPVGFIINHPHYIPEDNFIEKEIYIERFRETFSGNYIETSCPVLTLANE